MISILLSESNDGLLRKFSVSGHSGYGEDGSDIICSAISVLGQTAIASLKQLTDLEVEYHIDEVEAVLSCEVELPSDIADRQRIVAETILNLFEIGCINTAACYKKKYIVYKKHTDK